MFIPTTDSMTTGAQFASSEAGKTSMNGQHNLASGNSHAPEGAFARLLVQLAGQDGQQGKLAMSDPSAIRMMMTSALPLLANIDEGELQQLMEWLGQAAQMLEGENQQAIMDLLEQNPELLQWLASMTVVLSAPTDEHKAHWPSEARSMKPAELMSKLSEWLQQMRGQLASSQQPPAETVSAIRTVQQMLEPLLNEAKGQASSMLPQTGERTLPQTVASQDPSLSRAEQLVRSSMLNAEQTSKPQAELAFRQMAVQVSKSEVSHATVQPSMLPRADLLRPELLKLAMGEAGELPTVEGKVSETVLTTPLLANESAKGTAPLTAARVPTMQQVPVDQFVQEMNKFVFRSFQITQLNGVSEAKISLVPEHLGQVDIKLTMHNGHLTATLVAETMMGREVLEQQLGQLRAVLQGQGIQVEKLEVTTQANASSTPFFRDQDHSQGSRQFEQRSQSDASKFEDDAVDFGHELELLQDEYETYLGVGGRSFHATA